MSKIRKKIKADFLAHYDVKIDIKKEKTKTESSQSNITLLYQLLRKHLSIKH